MLQPMQRLSTLSFAFLLVLSAFSAVLVHQVSPLRNATFQPNSANAGSLLPGWRTVNESTWLLGAFGLAILLAISLTIVFWQWSQATMPPNAPAGEHFRTAARSLFSIHWLVIGTTLFGALWLLSGNRYGYLYGVNQWVNIDVLAILLCLYLTGSFWLEQQLESGNIAAFWWRGLPRRIGKFFLALHWFVGGFILFAGFQMLFVGYLLGQWLVD